MACVCVCAYAAGKRHPHEQQPKKRQTPSEQQQQQQPFLWGVVRYEDSVEDEWFVVWLLLLLTRQLPGCSARCWDDDGEFLLIEVRRDCLFAALRVSSSSSSSAAVLPQHWGATVLPQGPSQLHALHQHSLFAALRGHQQQQCSSAHHHSGRVPLYCTCWIWAHSQHSQLQVLQQSLHTRSP